MDEEIWAASIAELAPRIGERAVSPVMLTELMLDRIAAHDDLLHSYAAVTPGLARASAIRAETDIRDGAWKEPLLIAAGHAYQSRTEWHMRRPVL